MLLKHPVCLSFEEAAGHVYGVHQRRLGLRSKQEKVVADI